MDYDRLSLRKHILKIQDAKSVISFDLRHLWELGKGQRVGGNNLFLEHGEYTVMEYKVSSHCCIERMGLGKFQNWQGGRGWGGTHLKTFQ